MENDTRPWILCDIDGTISENREREYIILDAKRTDMFPNWDLYHEASQYDLPITPMVNLINFLSDEANIAFVTARPAKWEKLTRSWLLTHVKFPYELWMRPDEDFRPSAEIKADISQNFFQPPRRIWMAIDDYPSVVKMYREHDILCLQPREGRT